MKKLAPALLSAAVWAFALNAQAASHAGAAPMKASDAAMKASDPAKKADAKKEAAPAAAKKDMKDKDGAKK
jgi:hypothetical protein